MMKRIILIFLFIAVAAVQTIAAEGWEARIKASLLNAENRLSFGQRTDAADGIDGMYDVPALLSGDIKAYFVLDGNPYWRDVRPVGDAEWTMIIESAIKGKTVTILWRSEELPAEKVVLMDDTARKAVNMKNASKYSFINDGKRQLRIVTGEK